MNIFKVGRFPSYKYRAFSDKDDEINKIEWRSIGETLVIRNKTQEVINQLKKG